MELRHLIDLEGQLARDHGPGGDRAAVRARDRALAPEVLRAAGVEPEGAHAALRDPGARQRIALAWLALVRGDGSLPGARIQQGYRLLGWLLVGVGLLSGAGAARAFLHYDGSTPVNVLGFVAFFMALQLVMVLGLLWLALQPRRAGRGAIAATLARLGRSRWLDRLLGHPLREASEALARLRQAAPAFADAERWTLFALTQRFGVAFNAGALATCVYLVVFSDLVFCWSTTLDVDAQTVHGIARGLALPWAWLGETAVPGFDVVRNSQWVRLTGSFAGGTTLEQAIPFAARWWRFLVAGVVAYGLLPRLAALLGSSWAARRSLARAQLDQASFQQLFDRLVPPAVGFTGPSPELVGSGAPAARAAAQARAATAGDQVELVCWGRLAAHRAAVHAFVAQRYALADTVHGAGGLEPKDDDALVEALRRAPPDRVVLALEAGQQPTRDVLAFCAALRAALGPTRPLVVMLVVEQPAGCADAEPGELDLWRAALRAHGDAHAWAEAVAEAP